MTDTSSKVNEDVERESKQPLPDAIPVIATTDHQQPLDKTTNNAKEAAADSEAKNYFFVAYEKP